MERHTCLPSIVLRYTTFPFMMFLHLWMFNSLGPRYISAPEVSLLILLESVLAPLLVWAVISENPGFWALAGGGVVIGALLVSNGSLFHKTAKSPKAL